MSWKEVERQVQIVEDVRKEVVGTTDTILEFIQANGALSIKQLELIDQFIQIECSDERIRTAFNKYSEITLKLFGDIVNMS